MSLYGHEDSLHRPSKHLHQDGAAAAALGTEQDAAETVARLRQIHSPSQLLVDTDAALSFKRPGWDLAIAQSEVRPGPRQPRQPRPPASRPPARRAPPAADARPLAAQTFRCRAADERVAHVDLVLKRFACIDRRMYDVKVFELDSYMRFQNHPCAVPLYTMWNEPADGPYAFKTVVALFREMHRGDLVEFAVQRPDGRRLRGRRVRLLACDIASALRAFHSCSLIHAGVRPHNIYVDDRRRARLGEFHKVELDCYRYNHHLFSKLFIAQAIDRKLAYWAPELLGLQPYGAKVDMYGCAPRCNRYLRLLLC